MRAIALLVFAAASCGGCQAVASYHGADAGDGALTAPLDAVAPAEAIISGGDAGDATAAPAMRIVNIDALRTRLGATYALCNGVLISVSEALSVTKVFAYPVSTLPSATSAWLGASVGDAVGVGWNPNGCDAEGYEDPDCDGQGNGDDWSDAGLIIRGAQAVSANEIALPSNLTPADINLIDIESASSGPGTQFKCEFAEPDDSGLDGPPFQGLRATTNAFKKMLVELATKP
ncbi:MAG: hypothetical protein KC503_03550 [Myxococcales bacterium]|nr:hypothetical protein [Myxococcales bacterium]